MEFQPESVGGEMREYQLEGLKWLVARYDDGINTILADEMVRGLSCGCEPDVKGAGLLRLTLNHS